MKTKKLIMIPLLGGLLCTVACSFDDDNWLSTGTAETMMLRKAQKTFEKEYLRTVTKSQPEYTDIDKMNLEFFGEIIPYETVFYNGYKPDPVSYTPCWHKAEVVSREDVQTINVPILASYSFRACYFAYVEEMNPSITRNIAQRLVIEQIGDNDPTFSIVSIIPDISCTNSKLKDKIIVNGNMRDFSGRLLFYTLSQELIKLEVYKKGVLCFRAVDTGDRERFIEEVYPYTSSLHIQRAKNTFVTKSGRSSEIYAEVGAFGGPLSSNQLSTLMSGILLELPIIDLDGYPGGFTYNAQYGDAEIYYISIGDLSYTQNCVSGIISGHRYINANTPYRMRYEFDSVNHGQGSGSTFATSMWIIVTIEELDAHFPSTHPFNLVR